MCIAAAMMSCSSESDNENVAVMRDDATGKVVANLTFINDAGNKDLYFYYHLDYIGFGNDNWFVMEPNDLMRPIPNLYGSLTPADSTLSKTFQILDGRKYMFLGNRIEYVVLRFDSVFELDSYVTSFLIEAEVRGHDGNLFGSAEYASKGSVNEHTMKIYLSNITGNSSNFCDIKIRITAI